MGAGNGLGPAAGLRARISRTGPGVTVVSLDGEIDLATAEVFATAITDTVTAAAEERCPAGAGEDMTDGVSARRVVLDLRDVGFVGARGIDGIASAHTDARRRGVALVVVTGRASPAAAALRLLPSVGPRLCLTLRAALVSA